MKNSDVLPLVGSNPAFCLTPAGNIVVADHSFDAAYDAYVERVRDAARLRDAAPVRHWNRPATTGRRIRGARRGRSTPIYA